MKHISDKTLIEICCFTVALIMAAVLVWGCAPIQQYDIDPGMASEAEAPAIIAEHGPYYGRPVGWDPNPPGSFTCVNVGNGITHCSH